MKYLAIIEVEDIKSVLMENRFQKVIVILDNNIVFDLTAVNSCVGLFKQMVAGVLNPEKSAKEVEEIWSKRTE